MSLEACNALGKMYLNGLGVSKNYSTAYRYFQKSASKDDPVGLFYSGQMLEKGQVDALNPQSKQRALKCYASAADLGHTDAMCSLGYLYETEPSLLKGLSDEDRYFIATEWYVKAAVAQNPRAMHNLGSLKLRGLAVEGSYASGVELLQSSADLGFTKSLVDLGKCYLKGNEVPVDYEKAKKYFLMALESNEPESYFFMGFIQLKEGSQLNNQKMLVNAGEFFRASLLFDKSQSESCYYLGHMASKGVGCSSDPLLALHYYIQSLSFNAKNGKTLCKIASFLTSTQYGKPNPARAL